MTISVALLTHNETTQFHWLMSALAPAASFIDEIVVVDDFSDASCVAAIRSYESSLPIRFFQRKLGRSFAQQRNYMKSVCRGDFVFFLDPDELPSEQVVLGLPHICDWMARMDIDACTLPRLNILHEGNEPIHPSKAESLKIIHQDWGDQFRLFRNLANLHWTMPLDEYLTGMHRCYRFPEDPRYVLMHLKAAGMGADQREFYRSLRLRRRLARYRNSITKRLPWRRQIVWVSAEPPI